MLAKSHFFKCFTEDTTTVIKRSKLAFKVNRQKISGSFDLLRGPQPISIQKSYPVLRKFVKVVSAFVTKIIVNGVKISQFSISCYFNVKTLKIQQS